MVEKIAIAGKDVPIEVLDSRIWPTNYTMSRLRQQLACKLSPLVNVPADKLFLILEKPKNKDHGHFALPLPQLQLTGNLPAIAQDLLGKFTCDETFNKVTAVGPFLNFNVDTGLIVKEALKEALSMKEKYGCNEIGQGKKIAVEYSSPNIAKPFHAGHLRSTVIGNFINHLYHANGFETVSINFLGDWGKQYGLLAIGFKRYGSEEELAKDPIRHLFDVYVRINKDLEQDPQIDEEARIYFKRMEEGQKEYLQLWERFRDLSIVKYKELYERLNVKFDVYSGESFFEQLMLVRLEELREKGLLVESQGAQIVDLEGEGLGKALLVKKDGATLYLTRDIAAAQNRFDTYGIVKSIYVVAMQQDHHLKQMIAILDKMQKPWAKNILHVNFGMVLGMKTRKGQVVFLEDILDDAKQVMHETMQQNPDKYAQVEDPEAVADTLAVSAIVIQDMAARRIKDYEFKIERVTRFEGDTGPYLQYAHSRLCSIERKSQIDRDLGLGSDCMPDFSLLEEKEAIEVALMIASYPDIVQEARLVLEPCTLVAYLMKLSHLVSTALDRLWVVGQNEQLARARLALYKAARHTIGNGLTILGLKPLERM